MSLDHAANFRLIKSFGFFLAIFGSAFSISFCGIGLGLYIGGLAFEAMLDRSRSWKPYPFSRLVLFLLASLLVSVIMSDSLWTSAQGFGKYMQGFALLYAGIDVIRTDREKKALVATLVSAWLLAGLSGLCQDLVGIDPIRHFEVNIYQGQITRLTGPFKQCNDYGAFLAPGIVFAVAHFLNLARQKKWGAAVLAALFLALLCLVLIRTISRSAILSTFAGLFVFCLFFKRRWRALLALTLVFLALWFIPSSLGNRLHQLAGLRGGDLSERILLIKTSLSMIRENPFFGLGLNTYSDNFPKFKPADYQPLMYAHNTYLQMATECGLVGLTLFLAFIASVLVRSAKKVDMLSAALWAGVFGILVNGLFESVLQSTQLRTIFWALLGAAAALASL